MSDTVYIGDDLDIHFTAKDADGTVIDITGATIYCDVQTGSDSAVACTVTSIDDGPNGACRARFTSAQTAAFTAGASYVYDGRIKLDGLVRTIGRGYFTARAAKTPTPA